MNRDIFLAYLNYLQKKKDVERIRSCYKYHGMKSMIMGDYDNAINYFDLWQYSYVNHLHIDKYEYDHELLKFIENILFYDNMDEYYNLEMNNKIKIVYLLHGILNASSVLPKILLEIIKHHDKSMFEIHVFVTEKWMQVRRSSGYIFMDQFKDMDCHIHYAPFFYNGFSKLKHIVKEMHKINPHIFISMAALAEFDQFFISSMKPAPIRIGFVFAHPSQFISKSFDYGISWVDHIVNNCPIPCINSGFTYIPFVKSYQKLSRKDYNIPDNAITIISTGRTQKFQNKEFLDLVVNSMKKLKDLHYVIVGPTTNNMSFLLTLPKEISQRIHIFGWCVDYVKYFSLADICLDTYPSGGGFTLCDAASLHIPIISFTDSSMNSFNQYDWNPAQEMFSHDSIILVDRNNLSEIEFIIDKLYNDKDYRIEMGNKAYISVSRLYNNISENIKEIEKLYIELVNKNIKMGIKNER